MKLLDYPVRLRKVADVGRRDPRQKTPTSGKLGRSVPQWKDVIMARRLRFNGTGSGVNGCPSIHEDLDTGEVIVHGPALTDSDDVARLRHLNEGEVPIVVPRELLVDFAPKEVTRCRTSSGWMSSTGSSPSSSTRRGAWKPAAGTRPTSSQTRTRSSPVASPSTGKASTPSGVPSAASRPGSANGSSVSASSTTRRRPASSICSTTRAATAPSARRSTTCGERMPTGSACQTKTSGSSTPGWSPCSISMTPTTWSTSN